MSLFIKIYKFRGQVLTYKALKPYAKKVNVLGEICFDLITIRQDKRINLCNVLVQLFVLQLLGFLGAMIYSKRSELDFSLV